MSWHLVKAIFNNDIHLFANVARLSTNPPSWKDEHDGLRSVPSQPKSLTNTKQERNGISGTESSCMVSYHFLCKSYFTTPRTYANMHGEAPSSPWHMFLVLSIFPAPWRD